MSRNYRHNLIYDILDWKTFEQRWTKEIEKLKKGKADENPDNVLVEIRDLYLSKYKRGINYVEYHSIFCQQCIRFNRLLKNTDLKYKLNAPLPQ